MIDWMVSVTVAIGRNIDLTQRKYPSNITESHMRFTQMIPFRILATNRPSLVSFPSTERSKNDGTEEREEMLGKLTIEPHEAVGFDDI
jgi:hypothetical protein